MCELKRKNGCKIIYLSKKNAPTQDCVRASLTISTEDRKFSLNHQARRSHPRYSRLLKTR